MSAYDDVTSLLIDVTSVFRRDYWPAFLSQWHYFGGNTNRFFKPSKTKVASNQLEVKVETALMRTGRWTANAVAPMPTPGIFGASSYSLNFNVSTPASNDFPRFGVPLQVLWYDLKQIASGEASSKPGAIVNTVERMHMQAMKHAAESTALHRHLLKDCYIALVNGTPKQNDKTTYAAAAATPTGTTCRIQVDTGSIAAFQQGVTVEPRSSTGTLHLNGGATFATVTDVNVGDKSVGLSVASGTVADIADNDLLYFSGEYSATAPNGLTSIGEWYNQGSTIYSVNRGTAANRWMNPTQTGPTALRQIAKTDFDLLSDAMMYVSEEDKTPVVITTPEIHTTIRNVVGEDAFIAIPSNKGDASPFARFGFQGLTYTHPVFGQMAITADPLATPNKVRFMVVEDWATAYPFGSETQLEFLPGAIASMWNWLPHNDGVNDGNSLALKADGLMLMNDICTNPRGQGEITLVTS